MIGHWPDGRRGRLEKTMFPLPSATRPISSSWPRPSSSRASSIPNVNTIFINEADKYGSSPTSTSLRGGSAAYKHRGLCVFAPGVGSAGHAQCGQAAQGDRRIHRPGGGVQDRLASRLRTMEGPATSWGPNARPHRERRLRVVLLFALGVSTSWSSTRRFENNSRFDRLDRAVLAGFPAHGSRAGSEGEGRATGDSGRIRGLDRLEDICSELIDRFGPDPGAGREHAGRGPATHPGRKMATEPGPHVEDEYAVLIFIRRPPGGSRPSPRPDREGLSGRRRIDRRRSSCSTSRRSSAASIVAFGPEIAFCMSLESRLSSHVPKDSVSLDQVL